MSQKEQYEVICRQCNRKDILDYEPPKDYECYICGPLSKEEKFSLDKPMNLNLKPKGWVCNRHSQTYKNGESCPECLADPQDVLTVLRKQSEFDKSNKKFRQDVEIDKTENEIRKKQWKKRQALAQAPLDTLVLIKQLVENEKKSNTKLDKLIEIMEKKK